MTSILTDTPVRHYSAPAWASVISPDEVDPACVAFERPATVPVEAFADERDGAPYRVSLQLVEYQQDGELTEGPVVNVCVDAPDGHPGTVFTVRQARQLRAALDELLSAYDAATLRALAVSR